MKASELCSRSIQGITFSLLLSFALNTMTALFLSGDPERSSPVQSDAPLPMGEEEQVKHARPFVTTGHEFANLGTPLPRVSRSTDDRLLPTPHSEVLVRPPKTFL